MLEPEPCILPWAAIAPPWLLMPGLFVVPPSIGLAVVLVAELLLRGVLLVVPTLGQSILATKPR
jgi:hypothetical protein